MATTTTPGRTRPKLGTLAQLEVLLARAEGLTAHPLPPSRLEVLKTGLDRFGSRWNHLTATNANLAERLSAAGQLVEDELVFTRTRANIKVLLRKRNQCKLGRPNEPGVIMVTIELATAVGKLQGEVAERMADTFGLASASEFLLELRTLINARCDKLEEILEADATSHVFGELRGYITRTIEGLDRLDVVVRPHYAYNYWLVRWHSTKDELPPLKEFRGDLKNPYIPTSGSRVRSERIAWHVQLQRYATFVSRPSKNKKRRRETAELAVALVAYAAAYCAEYYDTLNLEPLTLFGDTLYNKLLETGAGPDNPFHIPHNA